jgi:hypothetical protein
MRVYLAARFSRRFEMQGYRADLQRAGIELTQATITLNGQGGSLEMPKSATDPQYAASLHRMRIACDHFLNALNGQY